jgi:U3 small nucleolar RNA-associated protein 19
MNHPLLVADYLSGCFRAGGLVAVLSLRGIFVLMIDHGLEYPEFFEKLYSLITPEGFASRHRFDLFRLLTQCLESRRISSYIVAGFVKRVARVALVSPAPSLYFALPFLRKLLQSHPNCLALIHRSSKGADKRASDGRLEGSQEDLKALSEGIDPFLSSETQLSKCRALYSTLWELAMLEKHFLPSVPVAVSAFSSPADDNAAIRFEKSYARLFTAEVTKEISSSRVPAIAYEPPTVGSAFFVSV